MYSFNKISGDSLSYVVRVFKNELLLTIIIYYNYLNLHILWAYIIYTWFDMYVVPVCVNVYVPSSICISYGLFPLFLVWFLNQIPNYLFSTYFLFFYYYSIYVCYFSKERQKGCGSSLEGRWIGTGRKKRREIVMKKIYCQQKNKITKSLNMINLSSFQRNWGDSTCHTT